MRWKAVSKWILVAALLFVGVQAANAQTKCRCGVDVQEYQILSPDTVRVWVFNYCRVPNYFLVNVVATAADDGALIRADKPLRVNPWSRMPVDVQFKEDIGTVSYWFATRLGATLPI